MHAPIHIVDAPKIDENEDSEVVEFIDKYITCALPDAIKNPEMSNLVKKLQTHYHTATTAQKMKSSIKHFFIKCYQIRGKLRSHLLKKSSVEDFIFCAVHL